MLTVLFFFNVMFVLFLISYLSGSVCMYVLVYVCVPLYLSEVWKTVAFIHSACVCVFMCVYVYVSVSRFNSLYLVYFGLNLMKLDGDVGT